MIFYLYFRYFLSVKMSEGYLYCLSNEANIGVFNIGFTVSLPSILLSNINEFIVTPNSPYKIEIAKQVKNPDDKKLKIHKILNKYRIDSNQNFFKVNVEKIIDLINLIDGDLWVENNAEKEIDNMCRDMSLCFNHKQEIRHIIGQSIWVGVYDKNINKIKYGDKRYNSPSGFSSDHYHMLRKDRNSNSNGWKECEYKVGDDWLSIYSLKKLN